MFEKAFVINLPFKADRLARFQASVPQCFDVQVWPAVHGDSIRHPDWWTSGAGAWGCYRAHCQILEWCYQNNVESYIVFEDDAIFRDGAEELFHTFMNEVPGDWQQIYFGGQLLHVDAHPPILVSDSVFKPYNVNRTQCFAVHRRGYDVLYRHLHDRMIPGDHIDHHLGRLHESGRIKVYCPSEWIIGQDGGWSNISGNVNGTDFFDNPIAIAIGDIPKSKACVFLESSIDVAIELERRSWHRGYWQNGDRLDRGICEAVASKDVLGGLKTWCGWVVPEAVRQGSKCVCLYHPELTWETVSQLEIDHLLRIRAVTANEAQQQLEAYIETMVEEENDGPIQRNLIYHLYPKRGNGTWQWNVEQLLKRIEIFDGVRSIGVVTDHQSDTLMDVHEAFKDVRIDNWLSFPNNPDRGEVVTFPSLLRTAIRQPGHTFYAHAKGVGYDNPNETREWTDMMYQGCLDDPEYVAASLKLHPMTGCFTNTDWGNGNKYGWHYSGTFFWFRNQDIARKRFPDEMMHSRWGVELWPGMMFELKDVGCLFGQNCGRIYNWHTLQHLKQWFEGWKRDRAGKVVTA